KSCSFRQFFYIAVLPFSNDLIIFPEMPDPFHKLSAQSKKKPSSAHQHKRGNRQWSKTGPDPPEHCQQESSKTNQDSGRCKEAPFQAYPFCFPIQWLRHWPLPLLPVSGGASHSLIDLICGSSQSLAHRLVQTAEISGIYCILYGPSDILPEPFPILISHVLLPAAFLNTFPVFVMVIVARIPPTDNTFVRNGGFVLCRSF